MKQRYCQLFLAFSLVIVFYLNSFSQTQVKGGIYSSTTWTKANSPYIILDTVVVFSGATLTIQAGVTVKFNKNAFIVLRQTNIIAIGNKDDYITFTSNTVNPTAGIYSGIILNGGTLTSQFNYCKFYYASSGISSSGKDKKLYVKNSIFSYNKTGIRGYYTRVDSCNFTNNNEGVYSLHNYFEGINGGIINFCNISNNNYGVLIDYGIITNCNITYNQNGVKYRDGYCVVSLINCNISYNGKGVVYINTIINSTINYNDTAIYNNSQGDTDCFYVNCNIKNNNYGILGRGSGNSLRIQDCNIDSNKVIGIKLYSYNKDEVDPYDYITNCRIRNNGTGVEIEFASSINNNIIENNTIGIKYNYFSYGESNISCNKLCNNSSYNFYNNSSKNKDYSLKNNYWCTTDSTEIASSIYDGYDNIKLGLVKFLPIDSKECYKLNCDGELYFSINNATCDTCHNGDVTASIHNSGNALKWIWNTNPIQTTSKATGLKPGIYSVSVFDSKGCSYYSDSVIIGISPCKLKISKEIENASCDTCHDGSAYVYPTNGTPPYIWTWFTSPLQTTAMATGLNSGTYKVCIIDALGCFVCDSSIFIDNKICSDFYIYASGSETACNICDDGTAWVNIDGGKPPYYYSWFTSPIQTKDTAKGLPVGKYKVCVKDSIGCIVCDSVSIYSRDCSAYFELYPTSTPYIYNAVNMASGMGPLKYEWSWGDGSFDTIALPTHNYNKAGFYKICLKITDSVGCINTYCNSFYLLKSDNPMITVNVIPPAITGIQENISNNSFNVYPNPCKDFIYISSKNKLAHSYDVIIKNLQGQEIFYQQGLLSNKYLLNLNYLKNGIYFLNINNYSGNNVYKIIIQN